VHPDLIGSAQPFTRILSISQIEARSARLPVQMPAPSTRLVARHDFAQWKAARAR
jgi:hypothetical protein